MHCFQPCWRQRGAARSLRGIPRFYLRSQEQVFTPFLVERVPEILFLCETRARKKAEKRERERERASERASVALRARASARVFIPMHWRAQRGARWGVSAVAGATQLRAPPLLADAPSYVLSKNSLRRDLVDRLVLLRRFLRHRTKQPGRPRKVRVAAREEASRRVGPRVLLGDLDQARDRLVRGAVSRRTPGVAMLRVRREHE